MAKLVRKGNMWYDKTTDRSLPRKGKLMKADKIILYRKEEELNDKSVLKSDEWEKGGYE